MKMKKDIYYCIVLSDSQLDFLAGSKWKIHSVLTPCAKCR